MTAPEAARFAAQPFAHDAVRLRRWDDDAKDPSAVVPDFAHYRTLLTELAGG